MRAGRSETDKQERQPRPPPSLPARAARRHRCASTCRGGGGAPARRGTGGDGGAAVGTVSARPLHRPRGMRSRAPDGCGRLRNGSLTWRGDGGAASPTLSVNATGIIPMMGARTAPDAVGCLRRRRLASLAPGGGRRGWHTRGGGGRSGARRARGWHPRRVRGGPRQGHQRRVQHMMYPPGEGNRFNEGPARPAPVVAHGLAPRPAGGGGGDPPRPQRTTRGCARSLRVVHTPLYIL